MLPTIMDFKTLNELGTQIMNRIYDLFKSHPKISARLHNFEPGSVIAVIRFTINTLAEDVYVNYVEHCLYKAIDDGKFDELEIDKHYQIKLSG